MDQTLNPFAPPSSSKHKPSWGLVIFLVTATLISITATLYLLFVYNQTSKSLTTTQVQSSPTSSPLTNPFTMELNTNPFAASDSANPFDQFEDNTAGASGVYENPF